MYCVWRVFKFSLVQFRTWNIYLKHFAWWFVPLCKFVRPHPRANTRFKVQSFMDESVIRFNLPLCESSELNTFVWMVAETPGNEMRPEPLEFPKSWTTEAHKKFSPILTLNTFLSSGVRNDKCYVLLVWLYVFGLQWIDQWLVHVVFSHAANNIHS